MGLLSTAHVSHHSGLKNSSDVREYFGYAEGCYLCLQDRTENISIARVFGNLTTFWRYSHDGRLKNIAFKYKEKEAKKYSPFIDLLEADTQVAWEEGIANLYPLPEEVKVLDGEVQHCHPEDQCRIFISRGIKNVLRLLTALDKPEIEITRRVGQQPLQDLHDNTAIGHTLEFIAAHEPEVERISPEQISIRYHITQV